MINIAASPCCGEQGSAKQLDNGALNSDDGLGCHQIGTGNNVFEVTGSSVSVVAPIQASSG